MKYAIKEKIWSFGDQFKIKDESGAEVFQVVEKVFSIGKQLSLQDASGTQLYFMKQKLGLMPTIEVLKGPDDSGAQHFMVKKKLGWTPKFDVDASDGSNYQLDGNFVQHSFTITKNGSVVATVDKKFFAWADTYGVDIVDGEDPAAILALCIIIDQVLHDK